MSKLKKLKSLFLTNCEIKNLQINDSQIKILSSLINFYEPDSYKLIIKNFFTKKKNKLGFYLHGGVGVGKTMILNFFYENLQAKKLRLHFNEFMINFHDYRFKQKKSGKDASIKNFVSDFKKKYDFLYLDEFQVTNIVDAMILGKLFESIFQEGIKTIFTSNIKIDNLYLDGLQRDQFVSFLNVLKKYCIEEELVIAKDYRKIGINKLERFFYPVNNETNFKINQLFRELTKNKKHSIKNILIKERNFQILEYYERIARFNFNDLCTASIGAEDYIKIADACDFILIEKIPNFEDKDINEQQRFITLIDIFYEKKIPLMLSSNETLSNIKSSNKLKEIFKRTLSRLYELTSPKVI